MRDSLGGTVVIVIITVFIVFALSYLAFNVNYTKAFRMKDKIISLYEDYDGVCGSDCQKVIRDYAREIGYSVGYNFSCPSVKGLTYENVEGIYCVAPVNLTEESTVYGDKKPKRYYKIVTKINLQIPVINNILDFRFFYISGDTKAFVIKDAD